MKCDHKTVQAVSSVTGASAAVPCARTRTSNGQSLPAESRSASSQGRPVNSRDALGHDTDDQDKFVYCCPTHGKFEALVPRNMSLMS